MRSSPTVWVMTELYRPELTSTGHYMTLIAERLAADGHQVAVLCGQPTYAERGTRAPKTERCNGVLIRRCSGATFAKDNLIGRLVNTVTLSASTLVTSVRHVRRGDVVIAVSNPPTMPLLGLVASMVRRARFVALFHDVLPIVLEVAGGMAPASWSVRVARSMTSLVVRRATSVVSVGRPSARQLGRYGDSADITVIPTWADDEAVRPIEGAQSALRRQLDLVEKRVALYAGAFGRANDLDTLLAAAELLVARRDITIVLCGDGPKRADIEQRLRAGELSNVVLTGPFDRARQTDMFGVGDVVVIPMLHGIGRSSMPSRAYNALAAGCPIVASSEIDSELAMLIHEHDVGVTVEPGDSTALAAAIERVLDDPGSRATGERARAAATSECSTRHALDRWSSFVGAMSAEGAAAK